MAVLGSIMVDRDIMFEVAPLLKPTDFYAHVHESIFQSLTTLFQRNQPLDKLALCESLRSRGILDKIGGPAYLSSLMSTVQTVGSAKYYATIVREKSRLRGLIRVGTKIQSLGYDGEDDVPATFAEASATFGSIIDTDGAGSALSMSDAERVYDDRQARGATYFSPWPALDILTNAFHGDELIVWAADEGRGKTVALTMLAAYTAMTYGPIAYYATEMGCAKMYARFLALLAGVSVRRQDQGNFARMNPGHPKANPLTEWEEDDLSRARIRLRALPITMFDDAMASDEVIARCRRIHRQEPIVAAFVDTLGALTDVSGVACVSRETTHERQKRAVFRLKGLTQELDAPVHVAHHLTDVDGGRKKLRDGGGLAQQATTVVYINETQKPGDKYATYDFESRKARDGSAGRVKMDFVPQKGRWLQSDQNRLDWLDGPEPRQIASSFSDEEVDLLEKYA